MAELEGVLQLEAIWAIKAFLRRGVPGMRGLVWEGGQVGEWVAE